MGTWCPTAGWERGVVGEVRSGSASMRIVYLSWPATEVTGGIKAGMRHVEFLLEAGIEAIVAAPGGQAPGWFNTKAPIVDVSARRRATISSSFPRTISRCWRPSPHGRTANWSSAATSLCRRGLGNRSHYADLGSQERSARAGTWPSSFASVFPRCRSSSCPPAPTWRCFVFRPGRSCRSPFPAQTVLGGGVHSRPVSGQQNGIQQASLDRDRQAVGRAGRRAAGRNGRVPVAMPLRVVFAEHSGGHGLRLRGSGLHRFWGPAVCHDPQRLLGRRGRLPGLRGAAWPRRRAWSWRAGRPIATCWRRPISPPGNTVATCWPHRSWPFGKDTWRRATSQVGHNAGPALRGTSGFPAYAVRQADRGYMSART